MDIFEVAKAYNDFQQDVGQFSDSNLDQVIEKLFTTSFTKTANGAVLVAKRSELKNQLLTVRQQSGKWVMDVKEILPFQDPTRCLMRYHLKTTDLGVFDIMALLRVNSEGLIKEIDEIYYHTPGDVK